MSKFTAGKWKIDSTLRRVSCPTVCMIRPETSNENIPLQSIAHIPLMSFGEGIISKQEAEANARLIAAAPEMYAIVEWVVSLAENQRATNAMIQEARELIKRVDDLSSEDAEHDAD